jgi:SAM-dependent methyltransferase
MMAIVLATAWHPRGELDRFLKLLPVLQEAYSGIAISLHPETEDDLLHQLKELNQVKVVSSPDWSWGRYLALGLAFEFSGTHIHYADFDRLMRWVETRQAEWKKILEVIEENDCLIIGRSADSYQTHPQALIRTEAISNLVVSHLLGQPLDVSAGSKAFSRKASEYILANCEPGHALGTDAEWPLILHRAGYQINSVSVDGLDWETADRFRNAAADSQNQKKEAELYDRDPQNWSRRVGVAMEIVQVGIETISKESSSLVEPNSRNLRVNSDSDDASFNTKAVLEAEDYLYFYEEWLTPECSQLEVDALVRELSLDEPCSILDLACGFGRHANVLAELGHTVTGVDLTPDFLEIARDEAKEKNLTTSFLQADMRWIDFDKEFDHVLLLFTSFGYFDDDENQLVFDNVSRALKPGGQFIFDTHNPDVFSKHMQPITVTEKGKDLLLDRNSFDPFTSRWYNRRIVIRDGIRKDKPFFVRLYSPSEIELLLNAVGMQVQKKLGGYDSQPSSDESSRMVIIAKKPETE